MLKQDLSCDNEAAIVVQPMWLCGLRQLKAANTASIGREVQQSQN